MAKTTHFFIQTFPLREFEMAWPSEQVEISYGAFRRVLPLPADADGNAIEAHYHSGILQIIVPRKRKSAQ